MQPRSAWTSCVVIIASFFYAAAPNLRAAPALPIPVEVWHVGDYVYTLGLTYALESAFRSSPDFVASQGKRLGTLVVTIPTNLTWKRRWLGRTTVFYKIEFTSVDGQDLGIIKGSCSKSAFAKCAAKVVAEAKLAANRMN